MNTCPFCKKDFELDFNDGGECPCCGEGYFWCERCDEDYDNCWNELEWEDEKGLLNY